MAIMKRTGATTGGTKPAAGGKPAATGGDAFMQKMKSSTGAPSMNFDIKPGQYEALLYTSGIYDEAPPKEAIFLEFAIVNDDEFGGKTTRIYYNIIDKEGNDGNGYDFLKRDLSTCEFDDFEHNSQADFLEALKKWANETQLWVVVDIKKKGTFTNVYLNSVMDDQSGAPKLPKNLSV